MDIRKDIDDMLNNLKGNEEPAVPHRKTIPAVHTQKAPADSMSVDELLDSLVHENENRVTEPAKGTQSKTPEPEKPRKKRIVISGELPDYEAIRAASLEKDRLEAERKAAEEAERQRIEAEKKAAEEAERQRIEAERKAAEEAERQRIEAERKAAEEAERQRIEAERKAAEEAERQRIEAERKAAEEAERQRIEAERIAAEEAERQRIEAERKAAEEAERQRIEAERRAAEEAERQRIEAERIAAEEAERQRIEAERKAAEEAERQRIEAERIAAEEAERQRIEEENAVDETESSPVSFEEEINVVSSSTGERELSVDELMEAAIAAVKGETDPVGDMIDNIRDDAEKAIADLDNDKSEEEVNADDADNAEDEPAEEKEAESTTPKGRITSTLEKIMAEDPDEIIEERSEKAESDELAEPPSGNFKKRLYAVLGVIFAILACIGLVTVISKSIGFFGNFTSGNSKKDGFADVIYPTVIMDIESFDDPSQLTSDQVITAAIWSMIMSDGTMDQYEKTFDVVKVPAVDVESYAVKLFGDNLPELTHTTVGPAESRFYYNDETKSYNVPVTPVTFTYSPEIKSVTKNGNDYTLVVDYIDELPEWLPKTSSKSVQYTLVDTNEGYTIKAMKVLSESNNI